MSDSFKHTNSVVSNTISEEMFNKELQPAANSATMEFKKDSFEESCVTQATELVNSSATDNVGATNSTNRDSTQKSVDAPVEESGNVKLGVNNSLHRKETEIKRCLKSMYRMGRLYKEIRDGELYRFKGRKGCSSFKEYCEKYAKVSRVHIYRLIEYVELCDYLGETEDSIPEKTLRPLFSVKNNADRKTIWEDVKKASNGKCPKTADVERVVKQFNEKVKEVPQGQIFCKRLNKGLLKDDLVQALLTETQVASEKDANKSLIQRSASKLLSAIEEMKGNLAETDMKRLKDECLRRISAFFDDSVN